MLPVAISNNLYWVGAVDWNVRDFHGYSTYKGTSYNAYLLLGEKNVLFDTVKAPFCRELVDNIRSLIQLEKIDYVVVNRRKPILLVECKWADTEVYRGLR